MFGLSLPSRCGLMTDKMMWFGNCLAKRLNVDSLKYHFVSPPNKVVVATNDTAWRRQEDELNTARDKIQDYLKSLLANRRCPDAKEREIKELKAEKKTMEASVLGAKEQTSALIRTNKTLNLANNALKEV
ncbi:hypothetical protein GGU10DRAFT_382176 [Lentinula aff. detonsa]|uniref:Uncharacterized protein n=1 Tax=Lentinula aff. detonsa TaxID=2804958 RepID=A0AA38KCQ7_9AGAR|nr:hypothetical protein GGU10DRAFT_382176 [Lentinula aff. detonsa]